MKTINCPYCGRWMYFTGCSFRCDNKHDRFAIFFNYPYPDETEKLEKIREDIRQKKLAIK